MQLETQLEQKCRQQHKTTIDEKQYCTETTLEYCHRTTKIPTNETETKMAATENNSRKTIACRTTIQCISNIHNTTITNTQGKLINGKLHLISQSINEAQRNSKNYYYYCYSHASVNQSATMTQLH